MTIFMVGPNDKTLSSEKTTWNFKDALKAAKNGDTIQLIENFSPFEKDPGQILIENDINLLGHIRESEGKHQYTNVVNEIFIRKGANVTLKNIYIKDTKAKSNCLNIQENSSVTVENVLIKNESASDEKYPVVILSDNSNVSFNNVTIRPSSNLNVGNIVSVIDSSLNVSNSTINALVEGGNANLNFEETLVNNTASNVLFTYNKSIVNFNSVRLFGGKVLTDTSYPCVKINNSKGKFKDVKIEKPKHSEEPTNVESYPIVELNENSNISFNEVTIKPSSDSHIGNMIPVIDSLLEVSNSTINSLIQGNNAELNFNEALINNSDSNALYTYNNSIVNLNSVRIYGGKITEDLNWSCVKLNNCKGIFKNLLIEQPNYNSALELVDSSVTMDNSQVDSLSLFTSNININDTRIVESLACHDNSKIKSTFLEIVGKENGQINLFADNNSSIDANQINFGKESFPNIKLERNVEFNTEKINSLAYDANKEDFEKDLNGNFIIIDKEIDIEYFGEKKTSDDLDKDFKEKKTSDNLDKDFEEKKTPNTLDEYFDGLIGIHSVKNDVEEFVAVAQMNRLREEKGLKGSVMSLHSMFLGNPGTGKTTVARIIGELLYENNVIPKKVFIEVSRSDLVGNYIGQTATKTREILESALGGVLFIDEAYTLARGGSKDFGIEAINEILSFMENHRSDIVIIFAGYTDEMNEFLETNDGLKSRIPNIFDFPEYTIDELIQIGLIDMHEQQYHINEEIYGELIINNYEHTYDYSNGRWVRNLNERIIRRLAIRIMGSENPDVTKILDEDLYSLMI